MLISALSNALKMSLMIEIELYSHMTDEEFELVRLNKQERRQEILKSIKVRIFYSFDIIRNCIVFLTIYTCYFFTHT